MANFKEICSAILHNQLPYQKERDACASLFLSAVLAVLVGVVILIAVLVAILVGILVLGTVLIDVLVLIVHDSFLRSMVCGEGAAELACPVFQHLSLSLKIRLTNSPANMAAVMPPAVAFSPPRKIPRKPVS